MTEAETRIGIAGCLACAITLAFPLMSGCVYDDDRPPPKPAPKPIKMDEPAGLTVEHIVLSTDQFAVDSDGNGFADSFRVYVYLFPDEKVYPKPIHQSGSMLFSLTDRDGKTLAEWVLGPEELEHSIDGTLPLKGYSTKLNLLDAGSDRLGITQADLTCRFIPEGGQAVRARGLTTVSIGPTGRGLGR
ncbi:MAG: hypothetical protein KDA30_01620 [Phycisphaerales bacterium]|nr:hypothetical protein [Phycisphaerales bacterium]